MQLIAVMLDGITSIDPRIVVMLTLVSVLIGVSATRDTDREPLTHTTELVGE